MEFGVGFLQEAGDHVGALDSVRDVLRRLTGALSTLRSFVRFFVYPTVGAVGCILLPLRGCICSDAGLICDCV